MATTKDPYQTQASKEVYSELAGQTAPLNNLVSQYGKDSGLATQQVNQLFNDPKTGITPQSNAVVSDLKKNTAALGQEQNDVFNEAFARINALKGAKAGEAQTLAQQLGAPVPVSMFTKGIDQELGFAAADFGGGMLNAQGLAAAGVRQAEAYSGTVLPMLHAREIKENKQFFDSKIAETKASIAALKAQAPGLIHTRARQYMVEDREFALKQQQAERDWYLAKANAAYQQSNLTMERERLQQQINAGKADAATKKKALQINAQHDLAMRQDNALQAVDQLIHPPSHTENQQTTAADGAVKTIRVTVPGTPVTDPNRILEQVLASPGVNKDLKKNKEFVSWLTKQIRLKGTTIGAPWASENWVYGQASGARDSVDSGALTMKQWSSMPLSQLEQAASQAISFSPLTGYPLNVKSDSDKQKWLANQLWTEQEQNLAKQVVTSH